MENAPRYLRSKDELLTLSRESTMQLNPHLSFNGQCQKAFKFYQQLSIYYQPLRIPNLRALRYTAKELR